MKKIPLTRGYFALVDDEDFERVNAIKWQVMLPKGGKHRYATTVLYTPLKRRVFMHRFVMNCNDPKIMIDHKDHDGINNQKQNLREATRSQNSANHRPQKGKTSTYLGVCKYKNKWRAGLKINGKAIHLGDYEYEDRAAIAYNIGAIKYHGEFANLNIVEL